MQDSPKGSSFEIVRLLRQRAESAEQVAEALMELAAIDSKIDKYGLFSGLDVDIHRIEVCGDTGINVLFNHFGSVSLSELADCLGCSSWAASVEEDKVMVSFGF